MRQVYFVLKKFGSCDCGDRKVLKAGDENNYDLHYHYSDHPSNIVEALEVGHRVFTFPEMKEVLSVDCVFKTKVKEPEGWTNKESK